MNRTSPITVLTAILLGFAFLMSSMASALTVDVDRADNIDGLPWGYTDVSDLWVPDTSDGVGFVYNGNYDSEATALKLSEAPWVDYMVAFNGGIAGVLAEKVGGTFLEASESTISGLSGGSNGDFAPEEIPRPAGEVYSLFANWTDGSPLPSSPGDWYGVSWGGWSSTDIETLEVKVNLTSDQAVNVAHFFNDGWIYSTDLDGTIGDFHQTLDGHEFSVKHYDANDGLIAEQQFVLPSGGAQDIVAAGPDLGRPLIKNHKQFYTATITVTPSGAGEYLLLNHRGGNIGYRLTAVTVGNDRPWEEGSGTDIWNGYPVDNGIVDTGGWLGFLYVELDPWIWSYSLGKYTHIPDDSGWVYIPKQ